MAAYESLNYMDEDSLFAEDELMVRNTVRSFVTEEVMPTLQEANRKEEFPKHLIPRFAQMGLLGSTIQGYDCPGLGHTAYGLLMQELDVHS